MPRGKPFLLYRACIFPRRRTASSGRMQQLFQMHCRRMHASLLGCSWHRFLGMGLCCRNMPFFQGLPGSAAYGPTLYWYAPLRERAALLLNARNGPRVVEPQNRQPGDRGVSVERRSWKVRPRAISARGLEAARSTRTPRSVCVLLVRHEL